MSDHDVARFNRWAATYDRHYLQRWIFEPVQKTILEAAREQGDVIHFVAGLLGEGRKV